MNKYQYKSPAVQHDEIDQSKMPTNTLISINKYFNIYFKTKLFLLLL